MDQNIQARLYTHLGHIDPLVVLLVHNAAEAPPYTLKMDRL